MSNENKSIHEFDFQLICEYFLKPGTAGTRQSEVTIQALSFIDNLGNASRIADIGCGTGARPGAGAACAGTYYRYRSVPYFIDLFNSNPVRWIFSTGKGCCRSMDNLPFQDEELDLIWSEGAIYNIVLNAA
jgi:SAM-dependent methyltransferase